MSDEASVPGARRVKVVFDEVDLMRLLGLGLDEGDTIRSVHAESDPPSLGIVVDSPRLPPALLNVEAPIARADVPAAQDFLSTARVCVDGFRWIPLADADATEYGGWRKRPAAEEETPI